MGLRKECLGREKVKEEFEYKPHCADGENKLSHSVGNQGVEGRMLRQRLESKELVSILLSPSISNFNTVSGKILLPGKKKKHFV